MDQPLGKVDLTIAHSWSLNWKAWAVTSSAVKLLCDKYFELLPEPTIEWVLSTNFYCFLFLLWSNQAVALIVLDGCVIGLAHINSRELGTDSVGAPRRIPQRGEGPGFLLTYSRDLPMKTATSHRDVHFLEKDPSLIHYEIAVC